MKILFLPWLSLQLLRGSGRQIIASTSWVALGGLILGVGSLVVSMAVVSGFESTLKKSVSEVAGEMQVMRIFSEKEPWFEIREKIMKSDERVTHAMPYLSFEAVLAHKGKISGVVVQGVDPDEVTKVLNLASRLREGKVDFADHGVPQVLIGQGMAANFALKVGDLVRIVVPINSEFDPNQLKRKVSQMKVAGIVDLGKHDYNERLIIAPLKAAQVMADVGDRYLGLILKLKDLDQAEEVSMSLSEKVGRDYRIKTWRDINENLFEAVRIERVVIFFVILLIVIAAAVNVSTSLYVNVVQKYAQLSILKSLGLKKRQLKIVFGFQGAILGVLGSGLGLLMGLMFCVGFTWLEKNFGVIPGAVYKIDAIEIDLRLVDVISIVITTLSICILSVWVPAKQGVNLSIVEGLRYE